MNQAVMISASLSTTTMISGSHLFNISGHSITKELPSGKCIMSNPFVVGGYQWAIMYYPNGLNSYDQPGIGFTLQLQSEGSGVEVRLEFCLYLYIDLLPDLNEFGSIQIKETSTSAIMAQHLLAAADRYSIERLKMICEEKLLGSISTDTVATTLALAGQHRCGRLKEACIEFLSRGGNT
ncbi:hypothetical protein LUZ61_008337 [Rhynchospora tenuis]|uniref:MATH domain-containing protein n=1 Tax=Rhynchospora tenuis TaxID=198213 RepID=A0AAD5ZVD2_9POAL|nr:hypothetical protein LUZ61_008337 [Rhynchospora tenuis]